VNSIIAFPTEDLRWLKWRLVLLAVALIISLTLYASALYFRNGMRRQEINVRTNTEVLQLELREIEQSERIIVENIDLFNAMVANGVLDEENRVSLLEDISRIRQRLNLFPIDIEIIEQERMLLNYDDYVEFPDEQITLRFSHIVMSLPLLHEQDLTRFLDEFLNTGRLIVVTECDVNRTLVDEDDALDLVEHLRAECEFNWYTLQREPFTGI